MYTEPNRGMALYAHNNKTDVIFSFRPGEEIVYDFRNQKQMKDIVSTHMKGMHWRALELGEELLNSTSFNLINSAKLKWTLEQEDG